MKKEFTNIKRFDENYYNLPREFAREIMKDQDFSLCHVPLSKRDYPEFESTDIFTILLNNQIVTQFYRKYNDGLMILEELTD